MMCQIMTCGCDIKHTGDPVYIYTRTAEIKKKLDAHVHCMLIIGLTFIDLE